EGSDQHGSRAQDPAEEPPEVPGELQVRDQVQQAIRARAVQRARDRDAERGVARGRSGRADPGLRGPADGPSLPRALIGIGGGGSYPNTTTDGMPAPLAEAGSRAAAAPP